MVKNQLYGFTLILLIVCLGQCITSLQVPSYGVPEMEWSVNNAETQSYYYKTIFGPRIVCSMGQEYDKIRKKCFTPRLGF
ncbi:hypothetical protein CHUAL_001845 [Chamberlinius hualienensis]